MLYEIKNKQFEVTLEVEDMNEHLYSIWLTDYETGEELPWDEIDHLNQAALEAMVDEYVWSSAIDNAEYACNE